jgi:predicted RNase H-like HicB family nuclease
MKIEIEREDDGRWIAEVPDLAGVMVYGATREEAISKVQSLALRVIADRLDHGEGIPELDDLFAIPTRLSGLRAKLGRYLPPFCIADGASSVRSQGPAVFFPIAEPAHNQPVRPCTLEQRALLQRLYRNHPGLTALVIMVVPSVVMPASVVVMREKGP